MEKTLVITGGNKGIGRAITESFLDAGYTVIVGARTSNDVERLCPKRVVFCKTDVREEKNISALANKAFEVSGALNVWINNVGISSWRPIEKISEEFFYQLIDTNLKSVFWGCKVAAKAMVRGGGNIINISSIAGKRGSQNNSMYCATKFGINGLTQSLSKELGPKGIKVNAICPVLIKTEGLIEALGDEYSPAKGNIDSFLSKFIELNSALGSLPTGKDVGNMAVFLASKENRSVTGQCINVDSGVFPQ